MNGTESNSVPVYTTSTGDVPKSALTRNLKVADNDPVKLIVKPRTKKHTPAGRKNSKVRHIKVDKRVWREATRLAKCDFTRIEVLSSTEVVVHHPGHDWKNRVTEPEATVKPPIGFLFCRGCGTGFPIPHQVFEALEHDKLDVCHRQGDHEAEGWRLEERA